MTTRSRLVPLAAVLAVLAPAAALAQGAFPAPLPGQTQAPAQASPFPPVNGAPAAVIGAPPVAASPPPMGGFGPPPAQQAGPPPGAEACMKEFLPLREEAERRGKAIQAAGKRRAPPEEACKLFQSFSAVEIKMVKFIKANIARCGIPPGVAEQMEKGHRNTEQMQAKVCTIAQQQQQRGPAGPSLSDVLGSSAAMPEATTAKRGGSAFDTLSGNVLQR